MADYQGFEDRHIGPTSVDESTMLQALGYSDLDSFIKDVVPANICNRLASDSISLGV